MNRKLLIIPLLLLSSSFPAQADHNLKTRKDRFGNITSITNTTVARKKSVEVSDPKALARSANYSPLKAASLTAKDPVAEADKFLLTSAEKGKAFGLSDITSQLKPVHVSQDNIGMWHVRYQQYHGDYPVEGADGAVHLNSEFEPMSANGRFLTSDITITGKPKLTLKKAEKAAKDALYASPYWKNLTKVASKSIKKKCKKNLEKGTPEFEACLDKGLKALKKNLGFEVVGNPTFTVYNEEFINNQNPGKSYLTVKMTLTNKADVGSQLYIDASSGKVLKTVSLSHGPNRLIYDCSDPFNVDLCMLNGDSLEYPNYFFGRSEGQPVRGSSPMSMPYNGSNDVDYAYDLIQNMHDYLSSSFGRNGANDRGGYGDGITQAYETSRVFVHVDGLTSKSTLCQNGGAETGLTNINFCVGTISPDLFGHEYGHLISRYRSFNGDESPNTFAFPGSYETGSLSENISDVFAEAFEKHVVGENDWLFGSGSNMGILRDLSNPENILDHEHGIAQPHPESFHDSNFYCGTTDNGGIHINATVPGKAAYLASEGGEFNGCNVVGIGLDKVQQIWYRALMQYYVTTETFNNAYESLIQSCKTLYTSSICEELTKSLQAVEMDQKAGCTNPEPRRIPYCDPVSCVIAQTYSAI